MIIIYRIRKYIFSSLKVHLRISDLVVHHAYYSVSIHAPCRAYLSFLWQGTYYHYLRLPNGYAQALLIFTKLLRLPFGSLRSQGHLSVVYMDDSYLQGDSVSSCRRNVSATVSLLQALGFKINERSDRHDHHLNSTPEVQHIGGVYQAVIAHSTEH